ncbi:hypothetical protein E2562_037190, partial [Oryza meyeriana var. granulata]
HIELLMQLLTSSRQWCRLKCRCWHDTINKRMPERDICTKMLTFVKGNDGESFAYVVDEARGRDRRMWTSSNSVDMIGTRNDIICVLDGGMGAVTVANPTTHEALAVLPPPRQVKKRSRLHETSGAEEDESGKDLLNYKKKGPWKKYESKKDRCPLEEEDDSYVRVPSLEKLLAPSLKELPSDMVIKANDIIGTFQSSLNILLTTGNNNRLLNLLRSKIVLGHTKLVSEVDEYLKSIGCAECKYKEQSVNQQNNIIAEGGDIDNIDERTIIEFRKELAKLIFYHIENLTIDESGGNEDEESGGNEHEEFYVPFPYRDEEIDDTSQENPHKLIDNQRTKEILETTPSGDGTSQESPQEKEIPERNEHEEFYVPFPDRDEEIDGTSQENPHKLIDNQRTKEILETTPSGDGTSQESPQEKEIPERNEHEEFYVPFPDRDEEIDGTSQENPHKLIDNQRTKEILETTPSGDGTSQESPQEKEIPETAPSGDATNAKNFRTISSEASEELRAKSLHYMMSSRVNQVQLPADVKNLL